MLVLAAPTALVACSSSAGDGDAAAVAATEVSYPATVCGDAAVVELVGGTGAPALETGPGLVTCTVPARGGATIRLTVFSQQATTWADNHGLAPDDCDPATDVAFRDGCLVGTLDEGGASAGVDGVLDGLQIDATIDAPDGTSLADALDVGASDIVALLADVVDRSLPESVRSIDFEPFLQPTG
jgi:hypothetical protein